MFSDGALLIRDLIEYVNRNNLSGLLVFLDQTKAYNMTGWSGMFFLKFLKNLFWA